MEILSKVFGFIVNDLGSTIVLPLIMMIVGKAFGMKCSEFLSLVEDDPEKNTSKDFPVYEWEALNKDRKHVVVLMMQLLREDQQESTV